MCFHYCSLVPSALIVLYKTLLIAVRFKGRIRFSYVVALQRIPQITLPRRSLFKNQDSYTERCQQQLQPQGESEQSRAQAKESCRGREV